MELADILESEVTKQKEAGEKILENYFDPLKNEKEAAKLSQCDLMSNMVKRFPELQGKMGAIYHENPEVSKALRAQHEPSGILGLAVCLDVLAGNFLTYGAPKGAKDPYKSRRAANGILKILTEESFASARSDLFLLVKTMVNQHPIFTNNQYIDYDILRFILGRKGAKFLRDECKHLDL